MAPPSLQPLQDLPVKTSALAVASFVLALLAPCTFCITGPVAIILGIIAVVKIAASNGLLKGYGFAIAGIAVPIVMIPVVAILLGILMPAMQGVRPIAYRTICSINMSAVGQAMLGYAADHNDTLPPADSWCDALLEHDAELTRYTFACPGAGEREQCAFALNSALRTLDGNTPADVVMLFDAKPGWNQSGGQELLSIENHEGEGCNIVFADGRVEFIRSEDVNDLRWTTGP